VTELESLIALNMVEGLGPITIKRLVEFFGSAEQAMRAGAGELCLIEGIGREKAARASRAMREVDVSAEIAAIEKGRFTVVTLDDPSYPAPLKQIYDPPPLLYVKGELRAEDNHAIAVVGARRCSHYGAMASERLAAQIAGVGLTVVSGLARGIDTAAHRGALKGGGRTIAVLGSGLGRIYPAENARLAVEIAASGAVVSEFPLSMGPQRTNFPLRNRIISGLSLGVLVIEAARKSGSLITAAQALEQGRVVFAVPGRIDSFASRGAHQLIRDGAKLVESVEDVCEEFPYLFPAATARRGGRDLEHLPRPRLTTEEETVFAHVSSQERSIDEIIAACGMPASIVSAALLSLELKHLVNQLPGKVFRRSI
jgi:DNA processing protein